MPRGQYERKPRQPPEPDVYARLEAAEARLAVIEQRINKMNETFATGYMPQNVGIP